MRYAVIIEGQHVLKLLMPTLGMLPVLCLQLLINQSTSGICVDALFLLLVVSQETRGESGRWQT